jgi:hypothetical protein
MGMPGASRSTGSIATTGITPRRRGPEVTKGFGKAPMFVTLVIALSMAFGGAAHAADEFEKYAVAYVSASLSDTQAGAHADLVTSIQLSQKEGKTYALTRDLEVHLPPGMIGNPQNFPRCTIGQFGGAPGESECPLDSQVGVTEVTLGGEFAGATFIEPIYNMAPPGGDVVARLGFYSAGYPTFINVRVDPMDYSLVASVEGAPSAAGMLAATTTLWGVPAASSHDELRLTPLEAVNGETPAGGRKATLHPAPFLSNPTDCSLQRQVTVTARSYQLPDNPSVRSAPFPGITGCERLNFGPVLTAVPTNPEAAAPTGLDAELAIPQDETPQGLSTSTLKSARVTLPQGLTINSAAGAGLAACGPGEVGFSTNQPSHCPDAAKIGSVEVEVPALEKTLQGSIYQRSPEPGHLFRFWVVTDEQGVHLKLPAEIEANPLTGQLTTAFDGISVLGGLPQVPFSDLRLHIYGGPRAPLATPASCGKYQTHYSLAPWSGRPPSVGDTAMQITSGCGKGGFSPKVTAGSIGSGAGRFAPFTFTLTREDGEANLQSLAVHLPQGLLAKLGGVPICPEGEAASGSCPLSSKVGTLAAATGVGGAPLWIPQPGKAPTAVYLGGPYKGAPFSLVSVVPAQAGPFDLGTVVNRAGIYVDPETALATIKTDPLPQFLEGVPVLYRKINVLVNRKNFTLNPTSCAKKNITATVVASDGVTAEPRSAFQATDCSRLRYAPRLSLSFKGSTKRTGNPAIKAVLTQRPHQANTKAAVVLLPQSEFIDNAHISTPCTRVQFGAGHCPKGSILGRATARTPLLEKPLKGPVYFRSNGGDRELPDIVADLHGAIHITLVGYIDSVKTGAETSRVRTRFLHVPDAPVTKFTMSLFGGKKGLVENSVDVCRTKRKAEIRLKAQNGLSRVVNSVIKAKC